MSAAPLPPDLVAERARRVVRASGLTQREFAARIGLDQTALSKALRGTRRLSDDELAAIAETAPVPLRFLTHDGARVPALVTRAERQAPRSRSEQLDPEARRQQIIAATAHLIARRGFHHVRVADIAEACGTSPGTLHYHFESKDEALRSALTFYAERLHVQLAEQFADTTDPREKLRRLIEVQLPRTEDDVDEWSIWMQSWNESRFAEDLRETQLTAYGRWRQTVMDLVLECEAAGHLRRGADPRMLVSRFTALVDGLGLQLFSSTRDMDVATMREILLDGFEPQLRLRPRGR